MKNPVSTLIAEEPLHGQDVCPGVFWLGELRMKPRLVVITTVSETLSTILRGQPRFLERFFDVVLMAAPSAVLDEVESSEGVEVYSVDMIRGISPVRDLWSIITLFLILRRLNPDAVHSYTPKAGLVAAISGWMARVPVRIHTFTGLIFPTSEGVKRWLLLQIDRLICACVTHVVPEGAGVMRDLRRFGVTKKPMKVIGYGNIAGVDCSYYSRSAVLLNPNPADRVRNGGRANVSCVFVYVGRLNADKGISELVAAFDALGEQARLLLVGALDDTAPVDETTLRVVRTHERVDWIGFQDDIRPALLRADVLVLPSYREGFPNVLLQAGAMEIPVIATDVNGSNEIVEPGLNGWLVPPRDASALAVAMREAMMLEPVERKAMGERARARVIERFEREAYLKQLLDFYYSLLGKA